MKELSTEIINIDGKDYTLFLNRAGLVAWEKYTKCETDKLKALQEKYKDIDVEEIEKRIDEGVEFDTLKDDANPFEGIEEVNDISEDTKIMISIYKRLYWIMWYTNHQLSISDASELFDKAINEYGIEQLILLGKQMIDDVNTDPTPTNLKNLTALKSTKK